MVANQSGIDEENSTTIAFIWSYLTHSLLSYKLTEIAWLVQMCASKIFGHDSLFHV